MDAQLKGPFGNRRPLAVVLVVLVLPFFVRYGWGTDWFATPAAFWTQQVCTQLIVPIAGLYLLFRLGIPPTAYGLGSPLQRWRPVRFLFITTLCIGLLSTYGLVYSLMAWFWPGAPAEPLTYDEYGGFAASTYHGLAAAFVEEVYFRGLLAYLILRGDAPHRLLFILLSSAAFAVSHFDLDIAGMAAIFYYGLVSALIYLRLRNLWPLIASHMFVNTALAWIQEM